MADNNGYAGKILIIDLSIGKCSTIPTSDYKGFIGGRGMAARLYWENVSPSSSACFTVATSLSLSSTAS